MQAMPHPSDMQPFNAPRPPRRGPRRRDRTNAVGSLVSDRLFAMGMDTKVREHMAPLVWAEMVGPQVATATEVDKVKDGTLFIFTRSAVWSQELNFHKADILQRLNQRIGARAGEPIIRDIRFQNRSTFARKKVEEEGDEGQPRITPTREELEDVELSPGELAAIEEDLISLPDEGLRTRMRRVRIASLQLQTWRYENGWAPCPDCNELAPPNYPYDGTVSCARCRIAAGYRPRSGDLPSHG